MPKEALIKFRCSTELKEKLEHLAAAREQTLSDYVRMRLVQLVADYPQAEPQELAAADEDAPPNINLAGAARAELAKERGRRNQPAPQPPVAPKSSRSGGR